MKLSEFVLAEEPVDQTTAAELLRRVNQTQTPYPAHQTVPRLFAERAAETPEAVAVVHGDVRLSYRELHERSDRVARFLSGRGLRTEDLVAIMLDRSPDMIVAALGAMKAGGAYLPVDPNLPVERLGHILNDSRAPVVVAARTQRDKCRQLKAVCPDLKTVLFTEVNGDAHDAAALPHEFDAAALDADAAPLDRSRPGTLAYVIYTSGTMGVPKGVMVEHRSVLRLVLDTNYVRLGPSDRILQTGALSFDASTFEIWGALLNGGTLCLPRGETLLDTAELSRLVREHGITVMWLTAGLFNALVSTDARIFGGLKTVLVGGEKLSPHHVNRARRDHPELVLVNGYGPTENTTFTTTFEIREEFAGDIPIGLPIANTTVYVLDEQFEMLPVGAQGELYAGGDGLARGYLNDPALTAAKFVPHPFAPGQRLFRTGDLARVRPDGMIDYLGRADEQIKLRGYRIEPGEIEARLLEHEQLKEAAVLARADSDGDRHLVAYYTARAPVDGSELRLHLRQRLPDYMVPAAFVELETFPLTRNGKVDRAALASLEEQRPGGRPSSARPPSATEAELFSIWQEVLCREDFGVDDNFFDLGGHSLRAVKLMYLVQQRLGVLLPFTVIFEASTVSELADRVLDAVRFGRESVDQQMVTLTAREGGPALFAFPPGTGDALGYGELARRLEPLGFYAFNFIEAETRIADYADLIEESGAREPYVLFGYSGGGNLAFRAAVELERRGRRVSDVVMLDSSRFHLPFNFPADEARRLALEFAGDEGVQAYVANPVLKDKVVRMIERYYETLAREPDEAVLDANIHVVVSGNSQDEYRGDGGQLICSKSGWAALTRGAFESHQGSGEHGQMLHRQHIDTNAALLRAIFESAVAGGRAAAGGGE